MVILINEQKVDFKLENEKKVEDIYNAIKIWLKESNHLIYSFVIDGKETDPEKKELWAEKKADTIEKIGITALTEKEYKLTGLLTVAEYINLLLKAVSNDSVNMIKELIEEYPSIIKNIPILINGSQGELISGHLSQIIKNSGLLKEGLLVDTKGMFLTEIEKISELINCAAREIEDPLQELTSTLDIITALIPRINEVSILLQTGKDQEAMGVIVKFSELLQKILRLISFFDTDNIIIDGNNFIKYSEDLNLVLTELVDAFSINDSVLIGDLLEYEITPKLMDLPGLVDSIRSMGE